MAHGEFTHIEIPYDDEARAKAFYAGLFGWTITEMEGAPGGGYWLFRSGPGDLGGGLGSRGVSAPTTIRSMVEVDDVDASLATSARLGGTTVIEKTDLGFGWYAVINDSEGNELGLYQPKARP